jgi:uncharacterized membrane protein required for colicin V production
VTFDLICAAVALLFAVLGLVRGLLRQLFGIAGFVGGLILARMFAGPLADEYHAQLGLSPTVTAVIFSFALFFACELAAKIAGNLLHGMLGTFTGTINRVGGLALGLAKGLLLVWVLASLAALVQPTLKDGSKRAPTLAKLDLEHSEAVALAKDSSLLGARLKELRVRAEAELKARTQKAARRGP